MRGPKRLDLRALKSGMERHELDAVVAVLPDNFFYLSGAYIGTAWRIRERLAIAVIPGSGDPALIVCNIEESLARAESWVKDIRTYVEFARSPVDLLADVLQEMSLGDKRVGIETTYFAMAYAQELANRLPQLRLADSEQLLGELRAIKTPEEIAHIRHAFQVTEETINEVYGAAHLGITEKQMADQMRNRQIALGAEEVPFCTLCMGMNTLHAHHMAGPKQLEPGDLVRVDTGGRFLGYHSDLARTAIAGQPSPKQRDAYRKMREVMRGAIALMKPGARACDIHNYTLNGFRARGLELFVPHIGHSIGIGIHERPVLEPANTQELRAGMLMCVEPGLFDWDQGQFHLEDLVHVTEEGPVILTDLMDTEDMFVIQ